MNKCILVILTIVIVLITTFILCNCVSREKYKLLRHLGLFPLNPVKKIRILGDETEHKYSGHRYKHRRRYNFLGQRAAE